MRSVLDHVNCDLKQKVLAARRLSGHARSTSLSATQALAASSARQDVPPSVLPPPRASIAFHKLEQLGWIPNGSKRQTHTCFCLGTGTTCMACSRHAKRVGMTTYPFTIQAKAQALQSRAKINKS